MSTARVIDRLMAPLRRRVALMVGRAVLRVIDDERRLQEAQISLLAGELVGKAERVQEWGFSSRPHAGAEAVAVMVGGLRAHPIIVATDDRRHRPTGLKPGESTHYDDQGQEVRIERDRIVIRSPFRLRLEVGASVLELAPGGITLRAPTFDMEKA